MFKEISLIFTLSIKLICVFFSLEEFHVVARNEYLFIIQFQWQKKTMTEPVIPFITMHVIPFNHLIFFHKK